MRPIICGLLLIAATAPMGVAPASATHLVVVPSTGGKDCVDLDSRWGVGAILAWKQTICGSRNAAVWVQTDCSQEFDRDGYWMATSANGRNFTRKLRYQADQSGSSIARFVCLSVGR